MCKYECNWNASPGVELWPSLPRKTFSQRQNVSCQLGKPSGCRPPPNITSLITQSNFYFGPNMEGEQNLFNLNSPRGRERVHRQVGRQVGRQIGKQVGRQIGRQVGRQVGKVGRQVGRQIGRQEGRYIGRQIGRQIGRYEQRFFSNKR